MAAKAGITYSAELTPPPENHNFLMCHLGVGLIRADNLRRTPRSVSYAFIK